MKSLLFTVVLLAAISTANAAVNLAISQQSGKDVRERAEQLAGQLGRAAGVEIKVVVLPAAAEVEAWLNRYATAELALFESSYVADKPGRFVMIGPVGRDLALVGRQGISGDLPQRIAGALSGGGAVRPAVAGKSPAVPAKTVVQSPKPPVAGASFNSSKSIEEDRYFVTYVYREKLQRQPEPERLEYWISQLQGGAVTRKQLFDMACRPETINCNFR